MPELRKDPIVGRWVIIATDRTRKPGEFTSSQAPESAPRVNPLADGNEHLTPHEILAIRPTGTPPNSAGWKVRVIPNTFPILRVEGVLEKDGDGIYDRMSGIGAHEVIVETPNHDCQLEEQHLDSLASIVDIYRSRSSDLMRDQRLRCIMVYKNYGRDAGAGLSHPHSQIVATPVTPMVLHEKLIGARSYYNMKERSIFSDILKQELKEGKRIVCQNAGFVCFCPYASRFPFELCILPRRQNPDFHKIDPQEVIQLADLLKTALLKLRHGLNRPQYNFIIHSAPNRYPKHGYWTTIDQDFRWHLEITPRLTQIAGFELGSGFYANPVPPEDAATFLKEVEV